MSCALVFSCGPAPEWKTSRLSILEGALDQTHTGVVLTMQAGYFGSGTLVHPWFVLTTAHGVVLDAPVEIYAGEHVQHMGRIEPGALRLPVRDIFVHPGYDPASSAADLALVRLSRQAPADLIPVPALNSDQAVTPADLSAALTTVGYGVYEMDRGDTAGLRRVGQRQLGHICTEPGGCELPFVDPLTGEMDFVWVPAQVLAVPIGPGSAVFGDSGGPLLIEREGAGYVAGVASSGLSIVDPETDEQTYLMTFYTKVDAFEKFIQDVTGNFGLENGQSCKSAEACLGGACRGGKCADRSLSRGCATAGSGRALLVGLCVLALALARQSYRPRRTILRLLFPVLLRSRYRSSPGGRSR